MNKILKVIRYVSTIPLIFILAWGTEILIRDRPTFEHFFDVYYIGDVYICHITDSILYIILSAALVFIAYKLPIKYKGVFVAIASTAWIMHLYNKHMEYIIDSSGHINLHLPYGIALIATIIIDIILIIRFNKQNVENKDAI